MSHASTDELISSARAHRQGVGAFNVITLEHAEAVVLGAERASRPVILQISENAINFHSGQLHPLAAACSELAGRSTVPVALHLDHVTDRGLLSDLEQTSISSVMFDASKLSYEDNVAATADVARWARARGLHLEAELGEVGGKDGAHAPGVRTDPQEAARFVARTGVGSLAVAVGNSHAMTSRTADVDVTLIAELREAVPVPLVLHGSSGVADSSLAAAVAAGMVKINVGTALNMAYTSAARVGLADAALVDPRTFLRAAREAMASQVQHLLRVVAPS
jgi:fructose-bisphosphate aldolase class II